MQEWYCNGHYCLTGSGRYSVALGYLKLIGNMPKMEVAGLIWNRVSMRKHSFISWLAVLGRLLTEDKVHKMGLGAGDTDCSLCSSSIHCLFLEHGGLVQYSTMAGITCPSQGVQEMLTWIKHKHWNNGRKDILVAAYQAVVYNIW